MTAANLITLTATIEDGDGDTDSAVAHIAQAFQFEDDGPTAALADNGSLIVLDETDGDGDDDGPGGVLADVTTSIASLYNDTSVFGKDGPKDADDSDDTGLIPDDDAVTYSLLLDVDDGTASGLIDTFTDRSINLYQVDDYTIEGRVDTDEVADGEDDTVALRIIVTNDPDDVRVIQFRAVKHDNPLDPFEEGAEAESIDPDKVLLLVTVRDGDLDVDSDTAELGALINIEDDGPAEAGSATLVLEEDDISAINGNDNDAADGFGLGTGNEDSVSVTLNSTQIFSGVDLPVSFAIDGETDPDTVLPTLLSQGLEVHWEAVTGGATEYVRGYTNIDTTRELIIELALTDNGDSTANAVVTIHGELDHVIEGGGGTENELLQLAGGGSISTIDFTPILEITDGDGDILPLNPGFLNAKDIDDTPEISGPVSDPGVVDFIAGLSIDNVDLNGSVGADANDSNDENSAGTKTYTFSFPVDSNGDGFFDANDTITSTSIEGLEAEVSADGTTITYFVDGFGGGTVDNTWEASERFFDVVLGDQGGSGDYTFNVYQGAPPAFTEFDFEDLPSGQNLHGTIANDLSDPTIGGLLLIPEGTVLDPADGTFTNTSQTTNTSKGGGPVTIGNTNQMFDPGEGHYFVYVSDTNPAMVAGAGLDQNNADDADTVEFGGTEPIKTAQVEIVQIQGNSPATINIQAFDVDFDDFADDGGDLTRIDTDAEARLFVENPDTYLTDTDGVAPGIQQPKITSISVYNTADLDAAADPSTVTPLYTVDIGDGDIMGVTWNNGGESVDVGNLGANVTVEFTTDVPHDMALVSNVVGKYDLGGFNLLQVDETPDQLFDYTVEITDFDGDTAAETFQVLVDGTGKFDDGVFDLNPDV
ncbi:hypothetical protein BOA8489_02817 [Boseongicola aestuarii]|uniref:DUF5801 domain-containing protein n=2 Tax=Boseongicola aestuarii TaxID=1470561 RepID=A0A238J3Z8_9RHOB|nr:hypothetical protein BOA8489_02817 [Boseongicola aestuarii]